MVGGHCRAKSIGGPANFMIHIVYVMQSVTSVNLHRFGSGLLVEVVGEGPDQEVIVRSFELELVDADNGLVRPRSPLAAGEATLFEDRLLDKGYRMVSESAPSATL